MNTPHPDEVEALRAELDEAAELLTATEWNASYEDTFCMICDNSKPYPAPKNPGDGHRPDCRLAAFLRRSTSAKKDEP